MTSQGHVTAAALKQAHKEDNKEVFFIHLYLKKFCASILETSHNKLRSPNQYVLKFDHDQANSHRVIYKRFGVEEYWSNIS